MSRLSFAVTIAVLVCAVVVLSIFALQKLFVSGPGNEGSAEPTEEMTQATQETTQATQTTEETTASGEETTTHGEITITNPVGGTSVLQEEDVLEEPPDSTLSYGGREVRRSPPSDGSVCWVTRENQGCIPFDSGSMGVIPPKKKLYVPSGSEMVFRYEAPRPPNKVTANALPILGLTPEGYARLGSRRYRPVVHGSGVERTIPAKLPPREYLVSVYVEDPQGTISYPYFRIMVQ